MSSKKTEGALVAVVVAVAVVIWLGSQWWFWVIVGVLALLWAIGSFSHKEPPVAKRARSNERLYTDARRDAEIEVSTHVYNERSAEWEQESIIRCTEAFLGCAATAFTTKSASTATSNVETMASFLRQDLATRSTALWPIFEKAKLRSMAIVQGLAPDPIAYDYIIPEVEERFEDELAQAMTSVKDQQWVTAADVLRRMAYKMEIASPKIKNRHRELNLILLESFPMWQTIYKKIIAELMLPRDKPLKQTELYKLLPNFDQAEIREVVYWANEKGTIVRAKKGNTYVLELKPLIALV